MPHWPKPIGRRPRDYFLDRIKNLLNKLGNPEKAMPPIVHVAGTNGKGSTLAFIRYIMQAAGYKVHAYTSPHLIHFNERIVIAGNCIDDSELYNLLEECRVATAEHSITLFEAATITAFLAFSYNKADIALVEVGMGGRLDVTNVIDNPILTIITSISEDHTEYLGSTVEVIAGEKAGIMKPNVPCVIAAQEKSIMNTLEFHAANRKSPLYRGDFEWNCNRQDNRMVFQSDLQSIEFPLPSLAGDHQIANAGNAIAACSILSGRYGFNIGEEDISSGLQSTYWPARLERIEGEKLLDLSQNLFMIRNVLGETQASTAEYLDVFEESSQVLTTKLPSEIGFSKDLLPKGWQLFLDGAHNNDGASVLSKWVANNFANGIYIIFGVTRNRNVEEFLQHFKPYIKLLCAVCVKSEPHAVDASVIKEKANNIGIKAVECESIGDAILNYILKPTNDGTKTILICGSLFLARDLAMELTKL